LGLSQKHPFVSRIGPSESHPGAKLPADPFSVPSVSSVVKHNLVNRVNRVKILLRVLAALREVQIQFTLCRLLFAISPATSDLFCHFLTPKSYILYPFYQRSPGERPSPKNISIFIDFTKHICYNVTEFE
jgi:hypothetical protein